jgi:folylpolyglutamate synthase/dihydropteroate synthase
VLEWRLITSQRKSGHRNYRSWNGWALRRNKHHHPLVSVITNGLDHTISRNTIEAIAGEKAGITKLNVPVVIGEYTETKAVLQLKPQKKAQQSILLQIDIKNKSF